MRKILKYLLLFIEFYGYLILNIYMRNETLKKINRFLCIFFLSMCIIQNKNKKQPAIMCNFFIIIIITICVDFLLTTILYF
jgi:hypothetical protein